MASSLDNLIKSGSSTITFSVSTPVPLFARVSISSWAYGLWGYLMGPAAEMVSIFNSQASLNEHCELMVTGNAGLPPQPFGILHL